MTNLFQEEFSKPGEQDKESQIPSEITHKVKVKRKNKDKYTNIISV